MTVNEIREKFLKFFEDKGHMRLPSFSLIPKGDKSLLLINAGMTPLKPYFTGIEKPPKSRLTTCQKCVRTIDIDEVGHDGRHLSFFQMLGNFSFADYFKKDAILWAWEFLLGELKLPEDRLTVTVYEEDDEAFEVWRNEVGLAENRIFRFGKKDNFWEHGTGPCGPCSEIFFDRGVEYACDNPTCGTGCDCDRFMEIWNLVFIQFDKQADGSYTKLEKFGIDTGSGLERLALVLQGVDSTYEIDTFAKYQRKIREILSLPHTTNDVSVRIITDHLHSIVYMAGDGILPSNEGRGYVLRRLLRRALRHAKLIGQDSPFIKEICELVIAENAHAYPELAEKRSHIIQVLTSEEERFFETLDNGLALLEEMCKGLTKNSDTLPGAEVFKLYDTFGFPPELTEEMLAERGLKCDMDGFNREMEQQRSRARQARGASNYMGADETIFDKLPAIQTEFVGYDSLSCSTKILAIVENDKIVESAKSAESADVVIFLDKTPFYAESGGQKGDTGMLDLDGGGTVEITDCVKVAGGKVAHIGVITAGEISVGGVARATVHSPSRLDTAKNHTATHLLNAALRLVLGSHIEQAGSEVSAERLRFDFSHFAAVKPEELRKIEDAVNFHIFSGLDVNVREMPMDEARQAGAVMLVGEKGEKYGEVVRVVNIGGGTSVELCGGTHLSNTAQAGVFKITSEGSVSAGVRRIEAVTSKVALAEYRQAEEILHEVSATLKTTPSQLANRINTLTAELKQVSRELADMKNKLATADTADILANITEVNGLKFLSAKFDNMDKNTLLSTSDKIKEKVDVLLLASVSAGAVQFVAQVSKKAVQMGVHAGNMVKAAAVLCGGNGGGRPNTAQAGGKDISKVDEALQAGLAVAKKIE
ncbi:MAG: alanine--tRNA ligase [Turicibacter sp.]|nr:alanine--tRNA ligase [Turicibacter sp.]